MKIKVNDIELELNPGTSAIDAVFAAGYDVPYFCSQEYMSPIGACRMCLAKVGAPRKDKEGGWILDEETGEPKIFWFPNPMATCTTAIMEGMVIDTLGEEAQKAQRGMVEMTLINHPLDCPTCDKGGACELQDRSYEYGTGLSRFVFDKRHQEKHHELSNLITLDRERCIHCKRCVRYFEEIPGDEVLDFIERGGHTFIGTIEEGLPSNFTGNITDICPVGALLDSTSRFRGRNWEYDHTRSTSLEDASGSAIMIDARTGRIERIKAALNTQINNSWIDDGTRFGHEYADAKDRITMPLLRKSGRLTPVTWEEVAEFLAEQFAAFDAKEIGIVLRADATLEEGVAARALAEQLETGQLDHFPRYAGSVIPQGTGATFTDVATSDALLVLSDVTEEVPVLDLRIKDALKGVPPAELLEHGVPIADLRLKERMPRKREILTVAAPYRTDLMKHAGAAWQYPAGQEQALLELLTRIANGESVSADEASQLGQDLAVLEQTVKRFQEAENAVVIYGGLVLSNPEATAAVSAFAKAVSAKGMPLGAAANSYGLELTEVLPSHARYSYAEMLRGSAKALLISGLNPAQNAEAASALKDLNLLIVHDSFHTETTRLAQVVLPAKTSYEKEGAVVNLEGRYLAVNPAPVDGGLSEDFTGVVKHLGEALGTRLEGRSVRSARRVLKKSLSYDLHELPLEGYVPAAKSRKPSKATLKANTDNGGNVLLVPSMIKPERLSRNPHLLAEYGAVTLRLHPEDAAARGLSAGDVVDITVGGIKRRVTVRLSEGVPEGLLLLPATFDQPPGYAVLDGLEPISAPKEAREEVAV